MAERKPVVAGSPQIGPRPRAPSNPLGAELERFGQQMFDTSRRLIASWNQEQEIKAGEIGAQEAQTGKFQPRRDSSIVSRAYNRAGFETYFDNLKITSGDEVERIFDQHRDDPAGLEAALGGYQKGIESELNKSMPELLTPFREYLDRSSRPYRRHAAEQHRAATLEQATADLQTTQVSLERQHEQRAFLADGSPDSIADLALARNEYLQSILRSGPPGEFDINGQAFGPDENRTGVLGPKQMAKRLDDYDRMVVGARIKGEFKRAEKNGRGERFALAFANDDKWLKQVTLDERDGLASWMRGEINFRRSMREADDRTLGAAVSAAVNAVESGETPGGLDQLTARVRGTKYELPLRLALGNQDELVQFRRMAPAEQASQLAAAKQGLKGVSLNAVSAERYALETASRTAKINAMERTQVATAEALQKDAFGFAVAVGNIAPPPPMLTPDGGLSQASLESRSIEAKRMSELYGRRVMPMTEGELDALGSVQVGSDPVTRSARTAQLVEFLGDEQALTVFEAMDGKGYLVDAVAGGLTLEGAPDISEMIYQGDFALNPPVPGAKPAVILKDEQFDVTYSGEIGNAMALNPNARVATREAVKRVYAALAIRRNKALDDVDPNLVEEATRMVLGGSLITHQVGFFGHKIKVTPPVRGATDDDFENWWDSIDAARIKAGGGMAGWEDEAAAETVRERGIPVEIRQGEYKIVIPGDGDLDLTKTVKGKNGRALVLRYAPAR